MLLTICCFNFCAIIIIISALLFNRCCLVASASAAVVFGVLLCCYFFAIVLLLRCFVAIIILLLLFCRYCRTPPVSDVCSFCAAREILQRDFAYRRFAPLDNCCVSCNSFRLSVIKNARASSAGYCFTAVCRCVASSAAAAAARGGARWVATVVAAARGG